MPSPLAPAPRWSMRPPLPASLFVPACLVLAWSAGALEAEPPPATAGDVPIVVQTREGSSFAALLRAGEAFSFRGEDGTELQLAWAQVKKIAFGERFPAEIEKQAAQAAGDLASEEYGTRQKALQRLRELGRAALRTLRGAASSSDPEVATRARQLLAEIGGEAGEGAADRVTFAGRGVLNGTLAPAALELQTRWGFLRFPVEALAGLESAPAAPGLAPAPPGAKAVEAAGPAPQLGFRPAQRFGPEDAEEGILMDPRAARTALAGMPRADFDRGPDGKSRLGIGNSVEDLHAPLGVLLRAGDPKQAVVADDGEKLFSPSGGMAAAVKEPPGQGDLEVRFILPGTFDPQTRRGRPGGTYLAGCWIGKASLGQIGLEAYDRTGRVLVALKNRQEGNVAAGGAMASEFLGVRSEVPIVRVRIFRTPGNEAAALRIDDLVFDRIVPADRDPALALLELRSGEKLAGQLAGLAGEKLSFRPAFVPPGAVPAAIGLDEVQRYEPPVRLGEQPMPPARGGTPHAVRLQDGEAFRACLMKLDANQGLFTLPGGVELALPRKLLRKVDLCPDLYPPPPGSEPAAVGADEKPGVEFRPKQGASSAPKPDPKKAAAKKAEADQPRMDGADVLAADFETGELTVDPKDGAGEWRIDLNTTRYLVFPPDPQAAQAMGAERDWVLTLRQGSRFEVALKSVTPELVTAEMCGVTLKFPANVVASIERKKK